MTAHSSAEQVLRTFGITEQHLASVATLGRHPAVRPDELVSAFYRWMATQPWKEAFFPAGVPDRVRSGQVRYWEEFLTGVVDDAYVESRFFVGATHARIGLPPTAYTAAMAFSHRWLGSIIRQANFPDSETILCMDAVSVLCQLDAALVMDAYADHSRQRLEAEAEQLTTINDEVTRVMVAASEGDLGQRYRAQGEKDRPLADAVNQMIESLEGTIRQAKAIAAGDYSTAMVPRSEKDELGRVLADMTAKLRDVTARTERDQWLKQGQAEVFEEMRGELSTEDLSRGILAYLARRLEAPVGCVYVPDDDGALLLAATYGADPASVRTKIAKNEGIIGEAADRGEPIFNLDVSAHPVRGSYGLGELALNHVTILPVVANEQLCGVVQLASLAPLTSTYREFLSLIAENVAIGLGASRSRVQMRALLEESQNQREELQVQAEELRASNEELEERSRALQSAREDVQAQNNQLQSKQAAIQKTQEELEERARELTQASKYKSEFLANMSHELRTPLNSMLILASNLCANPDGNLSEAQLQSIGIIHGAGEDLLRIINDILDLSKVEAGKLTVHFESFRLDDVVESLRQQFTPLAEQRGVKLQTVIDADAPAAASSDVKRVEQVLKNLLSNALKFTSEGSVALRVKNAHGDPRIRSPELRNARAVAFCVEDTGIGIPPEKQQAIFEAFQQADGSTSRSYGGTGLGLTVSRQLAQLLGGEITLKSKEGEGSTFTLFLPAEPRPTSTEISEPLEIPAAEPPAPAVTPRPVEAEALPSPQDDVPTLLIVEDDETFANVLRTLVSARGYRPVVTHLGKEALVLADRTKPKGIILDLGLPDLDGLRVLEQLKENLSTRHIPVHVISGHACRPDSLQLGAVGFLQKPANDQHLRTMFERFERIWERKSGKILVVEDDAGSQEALRQLLQTDAVSLVMASTAKEGLEQLEKEDFDIIVVDLGLPDMDGADFLKRLDESHPPVIVYTGQELTESRLHGLSEYTNSIVVKGARSPERLLDEVSLFLHQVEADLPDAQRATLRKLHNRQAPLDGKKVLVVDDDMRNLFAMTEVLQRHGMKVLKAKNGEVALDKLTAEPDVDIVITDIMMPVMDGFETIRRIRAQSRFKTLPIIAVTAKTLPEDRQACLEAGASDYIAKPMDAANLLALMRVLLFDSQATRASNGAGAWQRYAP